jgi:hypothetical protein
MRTDVKVKGASVKLPAALLPVEKFDDREDPQQQSLEPAAPSPREGCEVVDPPAPEVLGLCQALTGTHAVPIAAPSQRRRY